MGYGAVIGALLLGALRVDVNPLVVECGVGKLVDAVLVHFQPLRLAELLALVGGKLLVGVDNQFAHK